MQEASAFAPLTAALVRRAVPDVPSCSNEPCPAHRRGGRENLRLFLLAWAAGFVFFLAFLA